MWTTSSGSSSSLLPRVLLVLAGCAAWAASLPGPFLYDDLPNILMNPSLRGLWPPAAILRSPGTGYTTDGRPLLSVTLALNYAASGTGVAGYRATNLGIHLLAALLLHAAARRILLRAGRGGGAAFWISLLWLLHPLQTESVTYLVQRAESLMGLCAMAALYAAVRALDAPRPWSLLSVAACAAGMTAKEGMAVVPVLILLHDLALVPGRVRERRPLHLGLLATWGVLAACLALGGRLKGTPLGPEVWPGYLASQGAALGTYLWRALWPCRLLFDAKGAPPPDAALSVLLGLAALAGLGLALRACWKGRAWGFPAAWALLPHAPTSLVPQLDRVVEHRMYLPLAGVLALGVLALKPARTLLAAAAFLLGALTIDRNRDYLRESRLWMDTIRTLPTNARARNNLGVALGREGDYRAGRAQMEQAVRLAPDDAAIRKNLELYRRRARERGGY